MKLLSRLLGILLLLIGVFGIFFYLTNRGVYVDDEQLWLLISVGSIFLGIIFSILGFYQKVKRDKVEIDDFKLFLQKSGCYLRVKTKQCKVINKNFQEVVDYDYFPQQKTISALSKAGQSKANSQVILTTRIRSEVVTYISHVYPISRNEMLERLKEKDECEIYLHPADTSVYYLDLDFVLHNRKH